MGFRPALTRPFLASSVSANVGDSLQVGLRFCQKRIHFYTFANSNMFILF